MKHVILAVTVFSILVACAHVPLSTSIPSRRLNVAQGSETSRQGETSEAEWQDLYRDGLSYISEGRVEEGIQTLVGILAGILAGSSLTGYQMAKDSLAAVQAKQTLERTSELFFVQPGNGWMEGKPGHYLPDSPDYQEALPPSFVLSFRTGSGLTPIRGISCSFQFVKGSGFLVYGTRTDADGTGGCSSIHRDDPLEESTVRLSFEYRTGGYVFRFDKPSLFFTYPEPRYVVRIRTGQRMENLVRELEAKRLATRTAFLKLAMEENFPEFPFVPPPRADLSRFEGLFLPGVHIFAREEIPDLDRIEVREELRDTERMAGSNIKKIVVQLLRESEARFKRLPSSNGLKGYEQIILASIVEKEAAANRDYGNVASVFYNRLRWGSQLASCPAVEYALGYHRPFLTREDIRIDSPYNLYVREGLPPTPICFFSNDALEAVKNPPKSKFFYFVFDWINGKLLFAESFEEHMKNAEVARSNYIKLYGKDSLYRKHYDKFYEN